MVIRSEWKIKIRFVSPHQKRSAWSVSLRFDGEIINETFYSFSLHSRVLFLNISRHFEVRAIITCINETTVSHRSSLRSNKIVQVTKFNNFMKSRMFAAMSTKDGIEAFLSLERTAFQTLKSLTSSEAVSRLHLPLWVLQISCSLDSDTLSLTVIFSDSMGTTDSNPCGLPSHNSEVLCLSFKVLSSKLIVPK